MELKQAIARVVEGEDLDDAAMTAVMQAVMTGRATPAQIAGLLVALRLKGETVTEIAAAAAVMRELATGVDVSGLDHAVDIVGTGGDASGTFNVSTASIFVAAAAGCHVAKHGNRSVSSRSGAADVLEAAGLRLELTPAEVERCVREVGVGFMFAPSHHGAMKHAVGPRRELGVRTLFNVLGPLTNPAGVRHQLLGVFSEHLLEPLAEVLQRLGSRHVLVVHARDGLDEISIGARTEVAELKDGRILRYSIAPEEEDRLTRPGREDCRRTVLGGLRLSGGYRRGARGGRRGLDSHGNAGRGLHEFQRPPGRHRHPLRHSALHHHGDRGAAADHAPQPGSPQATRGRRSRPHHPSH